MTVLFTSNIQRTCALIFIVVGWQYYGENLAAWGNLCVATTTISVTSLRLSRSLSIRASLVSSLAEEETRVAPKGIEANSTIFFSFSDLYRALRFVTQTCSYLRTMP